MLIEHRVDDVNEGLVTRKETMPSRQQVAFQPALALVLAEDFHHAAVRAELVVFRINLGHVAAVGHLQHVLPPIRVVLVRTEETEVSALHIQLHHVAEKPAHDPS